MRILHLWVLAVGLFCTLAAKTRDPYKVLGISRSATQDEIKKAFNKRSRQYHPDRNKEDPRAKEKFQKVVNAYELLKDPERKKLYDMTGSDDPNGAGAGDFGGFGGGAGFGGGGFGINIEDLLNMGFGGFGGAGGAGGRQGGRQAGGRQNTHRTFTFSFGGGAPGGGYRFEM